MLGDEAEDDDEEEDQAYNEQQITMPSMIMKTGREK